MNQISDHIDSLNESAFENVYKDLSVAKKLTSEAVVLAAEKNYTKGIAWSLLNSGLVAMESGHLDSALSKLKQAYRIFQDTRKDYRGMAVCCNSMGLVNIRIGKMNEAFPFLQDAFCLSREHALKSLEYTTMNYLGILQFKTENYSQALRFFQKSLKLITSENKTPALNNLGCTYRALGNDEKALEYLNKALIHADAEGRKEARIAILEEIGLTYGQMKDYESGIKTLQSALELCIVSSHRSRLSLCIHMGDLFLKQQDYISAEKVLHSAEKLINESNAINHRSLYLSLSILDEKKGDHKKALDHYKKYHELTNKIKSSQLDEDVWQMETELLRKINNQITTISEMGRKLTANQERKEIIQTLVTSLSSLFSIDFCVIGEIFGGSDSLEMQIFNLNNGEMQTKEIVYREPKNIGAWVSLHNSGLMLNDIEKEYASYISEYDRTFLPVTVSSALCLPFKTTKNKGTIGIYSKKKNAFNDQDWEFMEMLTSYADIALNNAEKTETIQTYNNELIKLNKYDSLTGIYNRRHLLHTLEKNWKKICRKGTHLHLMLIDVDFFKNVNDTWGHDAGDLCLKMIGDIFKEILLRSVDGYGRYGGEEFIVYLQDMLPEEAEVMAEKIRSEIEKTAVKVDNHEIRITVSIGLCSTNLHLKGNSESIETIIKESDKNMYLSKTNGRNIITASLL